MLEYFEGILFLTSNRGDQLDEAFQSRIHLTINLPELGPQQRAEIWKVLVQKNRHVLEASAWRADMYHVLGELEVNVCSPALVNPLYSPRFFVPLTYSFERVG